VCDQETPKREAKGPSWTIRLVNECTTNESQPLEKKEADAKNCSENIKNVCVMKLPMKGTKS
jgi:hypothetical protein